MYHLCYSNLTNHTAITLPVSILLISGASNSNKLPITMVVSLQRSSDMTPCLCWGSTLYVRSIRSNFMNISLFPLIKLNSYKLIFWSKNKLIKRTETLTNFLLGFQHFISTENGLVYQGVSVYKSTWSGNLVDINIFFSSNLQGTVFFNI